MSQQPARAPIATSNRIWTIPNIISFFRLLGVPLFLWLLLGPQHDVAAVIVLAIGGTTDWVDGYVARRMGQVSRLGELLDPFADRLYILATLVGFTVREVVPLVADRGAAAARAGPRASPCWCCAGTGTGRRRSTTSARPARSCCSGAFPVLLLAAAVPATEPVAGAIGWGLAWWALGLYWAAAVLYLAQAVALLRADRAGGGGGGPAGPGRDPVGPPPAPTSVSPYRSADGAPVRGPSAISPVAPGSPAIRRLPARQPIRVRAHPAGCPGRALGAAPDATADPSRPGSAGPARSAGRFRPRRLCAEFTGGVVVGQLGCLPGRAASGSRLSGLRCRWRCPGGRRMTTPDGGPRDGNERRTFTPDFLTELFRNPLEPGYADAAARRARGEGRPGRPRR